MPLNSSGPISLGGSTTGQSVNLAIGASSTATVSFNDTAVRGLTGTSMGTTLSMPTNFWGKYYTASISNFFYDTTYDLSSSVFAEAPPIVDQSTNDIYVVGRYKEGGAGNPNRVWVEKIYNTGQTAWKYTYYVPSAYGYIDVRLQSRAKQALDSSGNLHIAATVGPDNNLLVFKVSVSNPAIIVWQKQITSKGAGLTWVSNTITGLEVDSSGNLYVFTDSYNASLNKFSPLITKLDSSGNLVWTKVLSATPSTGKYFAITPGVSAIDSSGNLYFGGYLYDAYNNIAPALVKCDSSGTVQWTTLYTVAGITTKSGVATGVVVTAAGNVFLGGAYTSPTAPSTNYDGILLQINPSTGAVSNQYNIASYYGISNMCTDANNNIYVNNNDTGGYSLTTVCKFSSSLGAPAWQRNFASRLSGTPSGYVSGQGAMLAGNGNSYVFTSNAYAPYNSPTAYGTVTYMLKNDGSYTGASTFITSPAGVIDISAVSSAASSLVMVWTNTTLTLSTPASPWTVSTYSQLAVTVPTAAYITQVNTQ